MSVLIVKQSQLAGQLSVPPSKSHTLRAIFFAALAHGTSTIHHYLHSPDTQAMIQACILLGAQIIEGEQKLVITGVGGTPRIPDDVINAGNSGIVLRFIAAVCGLIDGTSVLTGDYSIRHRRTLAPLIDGLCQLGASVQSTRNNDLAPVVVQGPIQAGYASLHGTDSQPVSAMLCAASLLSGTTTLDVTTPGETPWVDMTLAWLSRLGVRISCEQHRRYVIHGGQWQAFQYTVPGDWSSAAFPIAAALVTQSTLRLAQLDANDTQGDKALVDVLMRMGARIQWRDEVLEVLPTRQLQGITVDINHMIDSVAILAVLGCFACGETRLLGAANARLKESDRLSAMYTELSKMGADMTVTDDGLHIRQASLQGATVNAQADHRVALSLAVAGLACASPTVIEGAECIHKTYGDFPDAMCRLGGDVTWR